MIVILRPDTPRDSEPVRAVVELASRYPGVTAKVHEVAGATRSLIEVYLIGSTTTVPAGPFEELEASHIGQAEVEDAAIEVAVEHQLQSLLAGGGGADLEIGVMEQRNDALAFEFVVLHHEQALGARGGKDLDAIERGIEFVGRGGFDHVGKCTMRKAVLAFFLDGNHLHGNVPGAGIELDGYVRSSV